MAAFLDAEKMRLVFQSRPDILAGISQAADTPERVLLFNNIANYIFDLDRGSAEPSAKRRRVDVQETNGQTALTANGHGPTVSLPGQVASVETAAANDRLLLEIKDISVSIPQRKKFDLCFTKNYLYARVPGTSAPAPGIVYAWKDIEYLFYLPVPEKAQLQYNFVLFPRNTCLPSKSAPSSDTEPLVFTVSSSPPKANSVSGPSSNAAAAVSDTYSSLFQWALTTSLQSAGNTSARLVASDPKAFRSQVRQAHRPGEPAVHVKAFRGSKDGYLFFLSTGILWGFKKPLLFVPLERIAAVSYTSVLQRTFNVVVEVEGAGEDGGDEEIEFAMLDQEDYAGIDTSYVRRHSLQDRSMAAGRKAKRELVEGQRKAVAAGEEGAAGERVGEEDENDGLTELERAQREAELELQDEEDEEEEDYDPGSEGESEGEGSSSADGDDGAGEHEEGADDDDGVEYDEGEDEDEEE